MLAPKWKIWYYDQNLHKPYSLFKPKKGMDKAFMPCIFLRSCEDMVVIACGRTPFLFINGKVFGSVQRKMNWWPWDFFLFMGSVPSYHFSNLWTDVLGPCPLPPCWPAKHQICSVQPKYTPILKSSINFAMVSRVTIKDFSGIKMVFLLPKFANQYLRAKDSFYIYE